MALIDVVSYKQDILKALLSNSVIVDLIDSQQPEYIPSQPDSLIRANLYDFLYIPDNVTIADCYILVECLLSNPSARNDYFNNWHTEITIVCHKGRMVLPDRVGTRVDNIAYELTKMFDGVRGLGFNELRLISDRPSSLDETFRCRTLVFQNLDAKESRYNVKNPTASIKDYSL